MKVEFKGPAELRDSNGNLVGVVQDAVVTLEEYLWQIPIKFDVNGIGVNVTEVPFVTISTPGVLVPPEGLRIPAAPATPVAIKAEVTVACGDCGAKSSERTLMTSAVQPYQDVCAPCEKARRSRAGEFAMTTEKPLERACGHVEWFDPGRLPIDDHVLTNMEVRFAGSLCTACTPRVGVGG